MMVQYRADFSENASLKGREGKYLNTQMYSRDTLPYMKLALYSGGDSALNQDMNMCVVEMLFRIRPTKLLLVTSTPGFSDKIFEMYRAYCAPYFPGGIVPYFVDSTNTPESIGALTEAKVILLPGGNTFERLKAYKDAKTDAYLKEFAKREDTCIIGFSAGSIIMTPSIEVAGYPSFDADENSVGLTDFSALSLVPFEVAPHYDESAAATEEYRAYSTKNHGRPIYLLKDGSGIAVDGQKEKMFGTITMAQNGEIVKVACAA